MSSAASSSKSSGTLSPASAPAGHPPHEHAHSAGLLQLTEEQIRTWTLEQKDRWWLKNVFRGDMPQLTLRSGLTGMIIGGFLSLTNLYVGAKTGWTLGVGITSVILAFAMFKLLSSLGLAKEFTLLENNCMQSIATSAGYMTAPLVSSLAAYMMVTNNVVPMSATMIWIVAVGILGVLFAFPLKRRFINDEQMPFPEGRAAGVVMEALHHGDAKAGLLKAKLLVFTAGGAAVLKVLQSEKIVHAIKAPFLMIPEFVDEFLYKFVTPKIMGTDLRQLTIRLDTDFVMMAAGGLMGIRTGVSILAGAVLNYFVLAPWMISRGDIHGKVVDGATVYGFKPITMWALWCGVAMMTTASLFAFFSKPQVIMSAFSSLFGKKQAMKEDPLKHIELPMSVFALGIPIVGLATVILANLFFGVSFWMGVIAVPLVFVFTLIAVNSTGLTSITPTGALGKLTQLTYGALAPGNITTNLMTAGITGEVASSASNLLMDIKPGYMLGGKPRHQAVGHVLGIFAGALAAVPVFYLIFMSNGPAHLTSDAYPFPGAIVWKAVAEVLTKGLSNLESSARWAALFGAVLGIVLEAIKVGTKGRFWLSAVGMGLAFVIPFNTCLAMFLGSAIFWGAGKIFKKPETLGHKVMVQNQEPVAAGTIAGGALVGILVVILENFVL
ncbi:MAG: OPT/YSL family transporter [Deltaproteobacteria bacterium]|nr:OPT/YSL family transporter [Deltaproteobacteria bacterium]